MEAVAAMGQQADLVVHALEAGVGQPRVDGGKDAVEVLADGAGETNEGFQTGPLCPGDSGFHGTPGAPWALVVEDVEEGLLQQVGAVHGVVASSHEVELGLLGDTEGFGSL